MGEICEDLRCVPGCRDDLLEENDEQESAAFLEFEEGVYSSEVLRACQRDSDWFGFQVGEGVPVQVILNSNLEEGDIDARLYAPDGSLQAQAQQPEAEEILRVDPRPGRVQAAGLWTLEIFARGLDMADYSFEIQLGVPLCLADEAEPDNSPELSREFELDGMVEQSICPQDEDWFLLHLTEGSGLSVKLSLLGNSRNEAESLSFEFFGPGTPTEESSPIALPNSAGGGGEEPLYLQLDVPLQNFLIQTGPYHLRVKGDDEFQFGEYRLEVEVDLLGLCLADNFESNDTLETAANLMEREGFTRLALDGTPELLPDQDHVLEAMSLCGDEDWFQVELREGDDLSVWIIRQEENSVGNTYVEIMNADGARVGVMGQSTARENMARAEDLQAGNYFLRIRGDEPSSYELRLFRNAGAQLCPADRYEENDSRESAVPIQAGLHEALTLCGTERDQDWYWFELETLSEIQVNLSFSHIQGDLELDLYYGDNAVSLNQEGNMGHSNTDNEQIQFNNRAPGTYYLRVRGLGDPNANYELELNITERVFLCEDDGDEPNQGFENPTLLGAGGSIERERQWLCVRSPVDMDMFQIDVPAGRPRVIAASFIYGDDGDLAIEVYDNDGMLLAQTLDIVRGNPKQCVVIDPLEDRDRSFFVRFVPLSINEVQDDDERLDYTLWIQNSEDCEDVEPLTPGVDWPHISE